MLKVALAQIRAIPGQLEKNKKSINNAVKRAVDSEADLIVLPELAINGYMHLDLAHSPDYIERGKEVLHELAGLAPERGLVVGHLDHDTNQVFPSDNTVKKPFVYNAASFLSDGKIQGTTYKMLLPDYQVFNESRYYRPGKQPLVLSFREQKIGILICEDLVGENYEVSPLSMLKQQEPDLILSLNAAPFSNGKWLDRLKQVQLVAKKMKTTIYFTNLTGSYDGYDGEVVFDGRSFAVNQRGDLLGMAKAFEEDVLLVSEQSTPIEAPAENSAADLYHALVLGIQDFFARANHPKAVLGLSGGIDSAVVAALAVDALGKENVAALTMPSHITTTETKSDAYLLAENLGMTLIERSIRDEFDAWRKSFEEQYGKKIPLPMTLQNKQARIRGAILMEYTNENAGTLLLTTGNKTELALGYCTLYGDMCGALAPLGDVSKLSVYRLAHWINESARKELIPYSIIKRPPTAELEDGQTDEENLPAPYSELSPLVDRIIETDVSREILLNDYPQKVVDDTLRLIDINEGKRRQAPPAIRVTRGSLGLETRMPMGAGYRARY